MKIRSGTLLGAAMLALSLAAAAQQPAVYPAKGQSAEKQAKDDGECLSWAKKNTGIDPAALAAAPPPPQSSVGGGERARGAVGGAAIGAIAGDTGTGAAVGAIAGGRQARQNKAAREQQGQAQTQSALSTYYRAYGACMSGRGYTVN